MSPEEYGRKSKNSKLNTLKLIEKQEEYNLISIQHSFRPSHQMPVSVTREGSRWVCMIRTAEDLMDCPVAYGDYPEQAMLNFDHLWLGMGLQIDPTLGVIREDEDDSGEYKETF